MNPLYDLVVIGVMVVMVFVNLYNSPRTSKARTAFFSDFVPPFKAMPTRRQAPVSPSHGLANILSD